VIKVFVYGGFTTNGRYHQYCLQGKTFLGKGYLEGYKKYILGGLHGILPENGERVQGEVYEIDAAALARLEFIQNYGNKFTRRMVDVEMENGEHIPAEAYIWDGAVS